jgi:hypothetical protein
MRDPARFIIADGEYIRPGDFVCIDQETGKMRRATGQDKNWFVVPPDAYQEDDRLCIPPISEESVERAN